MKMDPRTKLVIMACITTLALIYDKPGQLFLLLAGTVLILTLMQINILRLWGMFKSFLPLVFILFLVQLIFSPGGRVLQAAGPVPLVTSGGLAAGTGVILRLGVVVASASLFLTTGSRDFILGLVQWKVPYEIAFMVSVAMRFLPIFRDEIGNVTTAVQLRGIELKKVAWPEKMGLCRCLFFPVVYGAVLKAQQLAVAMEARCFRVYPRRTYLRHLTFHLTDYVLMLFFFIITLVLVGLHF
ncbi:cobalt ABC transporter permease [Candidatus Formimonas warabiya]|uniref:Cobalt ABC transporter permease n=2 Tax=Formimonas warabiya TaxID=1761012 RepID=A0A3G1L1G7_FORW1|nr:cobalt ABC transporter permease [Candidatus Formimonas warabiya]